MKFGSGVLVVGRLCVGDREVGVGRGGGGLGSMWGVGNGTCVEKAHVSLSSLTLLSLSPRVRYSGGRLGKGTLPGIHIGEVRGGGERARVCGEEAVSGLGGRGMGGWGCSGIGAVGGGKGNGVCGGGMRVSIFPLCVERRVHPHPSSLHISRNLGGQNRRV